MSDRIFTGVYAHKRSTKNKHVYDPVASDSPVPLRDVYLEKWIFPDGEPPLNLRITVEIADTAKTNGE